MTKRKGWQAARKRSDAARKAARTRWAKPRPPKRYERLGISKTALRRYELPLEHPDHRPMPPDVKAAYEKMKKEESANG